MNEYMGTGENHEVISVSFIDVSKNSFIIFSCNSFLLNLEVNLYCTKHVLTIYIVQLVSETTMLLIMLILIIPTNVLQCKRGNLRK